MARTPGDIYQSLQIIFEGTNLVGTYTNRKTGEVIPAITVGAVPNDVDVDGLEFIIDNFPTVMGNYLNSTRVHRTLNWCLAIVQHDNLSVQGKSNLYLATTRILDSVPRAKAISVPQSSPLKSLPMVKITFVLSEGTSFRQY